MIAVWDVFKGDSTETVAGKYRTPVVVATIALNMATTPTTVDAYPDPTTNRNKVQQLAWNTDVTGRSTTEKARIAGIWNGTFLTRSTTYPGIYNAIVAEPNGEDFTKLSGIDSFRVY